MKSSKGLPLTEQCNHWTELSQVPWDLQKYWQQRYTIFTYYDDGIYLTHDAWFGVTPEPVANTIAQEMAALIASSNKRIIIDAFAGVGNNSIAFASAAMPDDPDAFRWDRVIAIERDTPTLACAQHNASLYGAEVADRITWINGDSFEYLELLIAAQSIFTSGGENITMASSGSESDNRPNALSDELIVDIRNTTIFASPPWGGPGYRTDEVFDLAGMEPYNLADLYKAYHLMDHALFLPRTSDLRQLARLVPEGGPKMDVAQYCVQGASKALVAYIPASATPVSH